MAVQQGSFRQLGKNGPKVSAIGFGLMVLGGFYGESVSDEEQFKILDCAVELGCTFWDTSDFYGDSETQVGKWLKRSGKRDKIFLATKFGILPTLEVNSTAEFCRKACEASLEKLGVESIDLYYAHRVNPETPVEVTMRELVALQKEGKIKHIGLSEVSSQTLQRAYKIAPVAAVQVEYSLFARDVEGPSGTDLLKTCQELGVALVCYSPLGRGVLSAAFASKSNHPGATDMRTQYIPWFKEGNIDKNAEIVSRIKGIADTKRCSVSQLALAWLLKQGPEIIPIPGTKREKYLEDNWGSLEIEVSDEEEKELRNLVESSGIQGARQGDFGPAHNYADTVEET